MHHVPLLKSHRGKEMVEGTREGMSLNPRKFVDDYNYSQDVRWWGTALGQWWTYGAARKYLKTILMKIGSNKRKEAVK